MNLLNSKNIGNEMITCRLDHIRNKHNKNFLATNMNTHPYNNNHNTLYNLAQNLHKMQMNIVDTKAHLFKIKNIPPITQEIQILKQMCQQNKYGKNKKEITFVHELFYANGYLMSKEDMQIRYGLNINTFMHKAITQILTGPNGKTATKFTKIIKEEVYKDNTAPQLPLYISQNYYVHNNSIHVYTDGSKVDTEEGPKAGAGIYFKKDSCLNASLRIPGEQTSLTAELFAIEYAINNTPINHNLVVVTDNKTAIKNITSLNTMSHNEILKTKHRSIVKRIVALIRCRQEQKATTIFEHIYSHIESKKKKGETIDKEKWILKINNRKKELGYRWALYVHGNEQADKLAALGTEKYIIDDRLVKGTDHYTINTNNSTLECNTYRFLKKIRKERITEKMYNKPKRGAGWRDASTDTGETVRAIKNIKYYDGYLVDFIHKTRQLLNHNRKNMFLRTHTKQQNQYTQYMKAVYKNEQCILCEEQFTDNHTHYKTCTYSTNKRKEMMEKITNIFKEKNIDTKVIFWFGEQDNRDSEELTHNEQRINAYNKAHGDKFFLPQGIKAYYKELGIGSEWRNTLDKVMDTFIRESHAIYKDRCKEHAKRTNAKQKRWDMVQSKTFTTTTPNIPQPTMPKYNEIVDMTDENMDLIIDLTIDPPTDTKRKRAYKKSKERKKVKHTIITGPIPSKKSKTKHKNTKPP
jgi:RNase H